MPHNAQFHEKTIDNMERVSSPTHEFDLLELALILWKRRLILVGATLASFVIGVLFTLNQNVSYRGEL